MRRYLPHIATILIIITIVIGGFGHEAYAGTSISSVAGLLFGGNYGELVTEIVAWIVNIFLSLSGWILTISGFLLNLSISITMHIKQFVDGTPAIYTVWKSIRDISGMFIIFTLLVAAIKMILSPVGIPGPNVGNLVKTVVVAGILINFSFFIAGLGIDVSNIVSMQLYNAIAPANDLNSTTYKLDAKTIRSQLDGGISDIFMQSLRITSLYDAKTGNLSEAGGKTTISAPFKIILIGVVGSIIIITAAISFFLASLAFIIRFVILLFLLAFSPIWFASYAIPQLGDYAKKWTKQYMNQLLFMPAYLLLMYFALTILTSNTLFGSGYAGNLSANDAWYSNFLVLVVNAVLVIIMLNAPLLAALSLGATMPKWTSNVGADAIWKKVGGWTGGMAGRGVARIGGSYAPSNWDDAIGKTKVGNMQWARDLRSVTTGQINKAKFGSSRSIEDVNKLNKDVVKKAKEIDRNKEFMRVLALVKSNQPLPQGTQSIKDILGSMSEKERLSLGKDVLMDEKVIRHLKKSDFEAIKKSEDIPFDDQQAIAKQRKEIFKNAVNYAHASNDPDSLAIIKDMTKNWDSSDIAGMDESILTNPKLIEYLSNEHLKKIADGDVSAATKHEIAEKILMWRKNPTDPQHKAFGWMSKNHGQWLEKAVMAGGKTYTPA
jgi:hypothetical protein